MLGFLRKWSLELKRRRLKKERQLLKRYVAIEEGTREDGSSCHNCKAPLTGPYCHICGQRDDDLRRPIWTFFRELLDAIFDTDSKIVKTIILLVLVPGGLSRAFMEGKRARFLPPFRLYVVLLFVFFSTLSIADVLILDIHVSPKEEFVEAREAAEATRKAIEKAEQGINDSVKELQHQQSLEMQRVLQEARENAKELEKALVKDGLIEPGEITKQIEQSFEAIPVPKDTPERPTLVEAIDELESGQDSDGVSLRSLLVGVAQKAAEESGEDQGDQVRQAQERVRALIADPNRSFSVNQLAALEGVLAMDANEIDAISVAARRSRGTALRGRDFPYDVEVQVFAKNTDEAREGLKQADIDYVMNNPQFPEMVKKATAGFADALQNPREFNKLFNEYLPWAMVVLMPFFALILRAFHWGKRRYYLNQLVFSLHFHSFLFVMLTTFTFVVPMIGGGNAFQVFWWGTFFYLIIALKVGQDQGWIRALLKAVVIWGGYFSIMTTVMALVMFLGLSDSSLFEFYEMIQSATASLASDG